MAGPQLPAYLQNRKTPGVRQKLADSLGAGAPAYVSIEGGRFTLWDGSGNDQPIETAEKGVPYLDAVIIDSLERISKIYYGDKAYDPTVRQPPMCWSDNGVAPSRNASQPQSATCPSCQWFPWGSAVSKVDPSKRTKACQDYQKLALMVPGYDGIYLLRVPPNSLKPLREYEARFANTETDPSDVVTRISFERGILGTLNFRGVSFIEQDAAVQRDEALLGKTTDTIVGRTDKPIMAIGAGSPQLMAQDFEAPVQPAGREDPEAARLFGPAPATVQQAPMQQTPVQEAPAASRRPGRPRKGATAEGVAASQAPATQAPFPTAASGNSSGIQAGSAPNEVLAKTMDDFFGPATK